MDRSQKFPNGTTSGFIADEVEEILPELVKTSEEGWKSLNYIGLIPFIVDSVQNVQNGTHSLQAEIGTLQSELQTVQNQSEAKITAQERVISEMQKQMDLLQAQVRLLSQQLEALQVV